MKDKFGQGLEMMSNCFARFGPAYLWQKTFREHSDLDISLKRATHIYSSAYWYPTNRTAPPLAFECGAVGPRPPLVLHVSESLEDVKEKALVRPLQAMGLRQRVADCKRVVIHSPRICR